MKMLRDSYASSTHFTSPSPRLCLSRGRPSQMHARNTHATARVPHSRARTRLLTFSILHARCPVPLAAGRTCVLCVIAGVDYGPRHSGGLRVLRAAIATLRAEKERVTAELQAQLRAEQERSAALEAQLVRIPTTLLAPPSRDFDFRDGLHRRSLPQLPVHAKASSKPRQEPSRCVPSPISPVARWGEPTTCMRRLARSMSSLHRARHSQRPIRYLSTSPKQPNPLALPCARFGAASVPLRCRRVGAPHLRRDFHRAMPAAQPPGDRFSDGVGSVGYPSHRATCAWVAVRS